MFCLHAHKDQETVDPLDASQWRFYVVATRRIDAELVGQKTVGLATLERMGPLPVAFPHLKAAVGVAMQYTPSL